MRQATEIISNEWRKDGDMEAFVMRIPDTGAKNTPFKVSNPLGRLTVGVQTIKRNSDCNVYVTAEDSNSITFKFTADNGDVTIRVW
jgi:hypothetical protein